MRYIRFIIIGGLLILLGSMIGCKGSTIGGGSAGVPITGGGATSPASALSVTASPSSIAPSGTTVVTARVVDNLGGNVPDGTLVTFSFSPGDQLKASMSSGSALTVNGSASVTVTATTFTNAIAVVNATSGSASGSVAITITASSTGGSIVVSVAPQTITVGNQSTVTATVTDVSNNPIANVTVNFSVSNTTWASLFPATGSATTDLNGEAVVTLTGLYSGATGTTVTVSASVPAMPSVPPGFASVSINAAPAGPTLLISSTASSILTNSSTTITVTLASFGALNIDTEPITLTINRPTTTAYFLSGVTPVSTIIVNTNSLGAATIDLHSANVGATVTVSASYTGQSLNLSNSTDIEITAPPADDVDMSSDPDPASITVYGTATVRAYVTANGSPVANGTLVSFILGDSQYGTISNITGSTVNGYATTTFTASNKVGQVPVTAVAGNVSSNPPLTIDITPADTGSIQFISAVPQILGIKGSGQGETSSVTWRVLDVTGRPVADGTTVSFVMHGPGGGAYIGATPGATVTTGGTVNGDASVILHSGTTAGPVTIIASTSIAGGATISSSGSQISIGGGVPSATHFNLSTTQFNLPGLVISNKQATISAYIADRFGNYNVLTGTSVSFYTEAGAIDRHGITDTTGKTSSVFRTQAPNPAIVARWGVSHAAQDRDEEDLIADLNTTYSAGIPVDDAVHPRNGWTKVLAAVQGEEAFLDENGNGLFDYAISTTSCPAGYSCECVDGTITPSDITRTCSTERSEGFIDIGEPFIDVNDSGCRNDGNFENCDGIAPLPGNTDPFELFVDANISGSYDPPNGLWDGPSCLSTDCLTSKMIWTDITLAFTGHYQYCEFSALAPTVSYGTSLPISFMVGDVFTNSLTPGTTITITTSAGTLAGQTSYTTPDRVPFGPTEINFNLVAPAACIPAPPATCTNPSLPVTITVIVTPVDVIGCIASASTVFSGP